MSGTLTTGTCSVRIEPPYVIKQMIPKFCVIEAQRTQAALDAANESDIFVVPKIVELEPESGLLVLEYLPELIHPLDRSIVLSNKRAAIFRSIGQAIACLHARLDISYATAHGTRAGGGTRHITDVVLHGDCHPGHTLWSRAVKKVAVIDWSGMYISGKCPTVRTYGPRRRDTVYWIVELVSQALRTKNVAGFLCCPNLIEHFIHGYEQGSGKTISRKRLRIQYIENVKARFKKEGAEYKPGHITSFNRRIRILLMLVMGHLLFRWKQKRVRSASVCSNGNGGSRDY